MILILSFCSLLNNVSISFKSRFKWSNMSLWIMIMSKTLLKFKLLQNECIVSLSIINMLNSEVNSFKGESNRIYELGE